MNWLNKQKLEELNSTLKRLFYLPPADRKVLFVFSLIILVVMSLVMLHMKLTKDESQPRLLTSEEKLQFTAWCSQKEKQASKRKRSKQYGANRQISDSYYAVEEKQWASFAFDPNTADSTQLLALGFAPWQVRNIYKYRAKGGRFHDRGDLKKIYGMTGELLGHLYPLVQIDSKFQYLKNRQNDSSLQAKSLPINRKFKEKVVVDINKADTALLKRIPGIGTGFALKIVRYRQQLGGYVHVAQLKEIEHFPDSLLSWFTVDSYIKAKHVNGSTDKGAYESELGNSFIHKININRATLERMCKHPYLNFYQCKVIVEHRRKFGKINSLKDLSLYEEFHEKDLKRLAPYCSF